MIGKSELELKIMSLYMSQNISRIVLGLPDLPLPEWSDVSNAARQIEHFAKQGVKVRLK